MRAVAGNRSSLVPILVLACVLPIISSCIIIPIPTGEEHHYDEELAAIQPGVTPKIKFLTLLGEPEKHYHDKNVSLYTYWVHSYDVYWGFVIAAPAGYGAAAADAGKYEYTGYHAVMVFFDQNDTVKKIIRKRISNSVYNSEIELDKLVDKWHKKLNKSQKNK